MKGFRQYKDDILCYFTPQRKAAFGTPRNR